MQRDAFYFFARAASARYAPTADAFFFDADAADAAMLILPPLLLPDYCYAAFFFRCC